MKKRSILMILCFLIVCMPLLIGCSEEVPANTAFYVKTPIDVENEPLDAISVTLPDGISRQTVSSIQHDFIRVGRQIGGIVIVDIPNVLLDSPYDNLLLITDLLHQQLMPHMDSSETEFMGAGGNNYAYMEIYTGGEEIRYFHYLFRGKANNYDAWFAYDLVDEKIMSEILATVSAEDITAELNKSIL